MVARLLRAVAAFFAYLVALGLFERFAPRPVLRWYQRNIGAPKYRSSAGWMPGYGVVETIGRKTGKLHQVPVGGRRIGNTFWLVSGTGRDTSYVRNIEKNPNVRVRHLGRWHNGVATTCPDDDARRRLLTLNPVNGLFLWVTGLELLTVRIDLE